MKLLYTKRSPYARKVRVVALEKNIPLELVVVMIPREASERIEILKWEAFADDLTAAAINLYMEKVRHPNDFHKDFTVTLEANIRLAYGYIEKNLPKLKKFNLATIAVASAIGYIHFRLASLKVQGPLSQWFEEISKRPSMTQTIPVA